MSLAREMNTEDDHQYKDHLYDEHTLYVETNGHSLEEVKLRFSHVGTQLAEMDSDKSGRVMFLFNINENRQRGYVYVISNRDFYRIIGNNADGTPHRESVLVKSGATEQEKKEIADKVEKSTSWADINEECLKDDHYEYAQTPVIRVDGFVFVQEKDSEEWRDHVKETEIAVMRARANPVHAQYVPNILYVTEKNSRAMNPKNLRSLMLPYSHSEDTKYPIVSQSGNAIRVIFDQNTNDACFAQMMINYSKTTGGLELVAKYAYVKK